MIILFNYPSRSRPDKFFGGVYNIRENVVATNLYSILPKIDSDDTTMNSETSIHRFNVAALTPVIGISQNKIHAVNRDIPATGWDIMITMSDDMRFIYKGFDDIIRENMPGDLDALLHFPDSYAKDRVCTMSIIGRTYYERDGFVYNEAYYSMFCDEEQTEIAKRRGKYIYVSEPHILDHLHYSNNMARKDALYRRNDTYKKDQETFNNRKLNNFYL